MYALGYGSLTGGKRPDPESLIKTHDKVLAVEYIDKRTQREVVIQPQRKWKGVYAISPEIDDIFQNHENSVAIAKVGMAYGSIFNRIDSFKVLFYHGVYEIALALVKHNEAHPNIRRFTTELEGFVHDYLKKHRVKKLWNTYIPPNKPEWFQAKISTIRDAFRALKHKYKDQIIVLFPYQ